MKLFQIIGILCLATAVRAQQNVLLIIADDIGTDYCGFYENHLDTAKMPNVRKLLSRGVRFQNAWSNPLCSPTRAGILTGRYGFRTGVGDVTGGGFSVLDTAELSIPRVLNHFFPNKIGKANIGKWHIQEPMPISHLLFPNKMGYDFYMGNFSGQLADYYNWNKVVNGAYVNVTNYATTETTNDAISWVKTQQNKPFFLWLAYNAPHTPIHLPPLGLHSSTNLSGTAADIAAQPKAYFKATVEALDHEIGRLFDSLAVLNRLDSTDIIFIGDNGDDAVVNQNMGSAKGGIRQAGIHVPFLIASPSVVAPGRASGALVNMVDLFATIVELFGCADWKSQIPAAKPVDTHSILPILKNSATDIRP
jgi:arylsulfatase B